MHRVESDAEALARQALFAEVLLYLLEKTSGKLDVTPPVVAKLMQYVNRDWHQACGRMLYAAPTGSGCYGPSPIGLGRVLKRMKAEGAIETKWRMVKPGTSMYKAYCLRRPNLDVVPPELIKIVDCVLERTAGIYGAQLIGRRGPGMNPPRQPDRPMLYGTAVKHESFRIHRDPDKS
jgi:hypothetical protein